MDQALKDDLLVRFGGSFTYSLERTMRFEGGWSDHPSDRGGKTRYGITISTLRAYHKRTGSLRTVETLTQAQAANVYHEMFWIEMGIWKLPRALQGLMFDWSVHAGYFAVRSMQRHIKVKPDGAIGRVTLAALNMWIINNKNLVRPLAIRRMKHLCRLVRRDHKQGAFIVGWFERVSYWFK